MQFGDFFWDGDKRCVYESPPGFSYTLDGDGYRIYTPDDPQGAPIQLLYSTYELWSRYVDFMESSGWSTRALNISGGAYRYTDQFGEKKYSLIDLRLINDWAYVQTDYPHTTFIKGNLFPNEATNIIFDSERLENRGVIPSVMYSDAGERAVENPEAIAIALENSVFASFNGGIWIDEIDGAEDLGTKSEPTGTEQRPVKNIQLVNQISIERGFREIFVVGNLHLREGDDVSGMTLSGQNTTLSELLVDTEANTLDCQIVNFRMEGTLDNNTTIMGCELGRIDYINGKIYNSIFSESLIRLQGNADALFINCVSGVAGSNTPTIDMGGSGCSLAIRGFEGGLKIVNRTGTDPVSIDFGSGQFIADQTITNGVIYVRGGCGKISINCAPEFVDFYGVTNPRTIAEATWERAERTLTSSSGSGGVVEGDVHAALDSYINKDSYKADLSTIEGHMSSIPLEVWSHVTRELTVAAGLTPEQETKLFSLINVDGKIDILNAKVDLIPDSILDKVI